MRCSSPRSSARPSDRSTSRTVALALAVLATLAASPARAGDDEDLDYSNPNTGDGSWPGPSADERFCAEKLPGNKKAPAAELARCARFFADAPAGGVWTWKLTRGDMNELERRIAACKTCDADEVTRAKGSLQAGRELHAGLTDPGTGASIEPLLEKVLAGKKLTRPELRLATPFTLWRLRNAPYARHGRPFKSPELASFYYGARGKGLGAPSKLLPLKQDAAFNDAMLDKIDEANVSLVVGEIRRKKAE